MVEAPSRPKMVTRWLPYIALACAVSIFSLGGIFVRLAQAQHVPSLVIVTLRYTFAAFFLAPYVLTHYRGELRRMPRRDVGLIFVAGIAIAISLFLYFSTLEHTTVMITNLFSNTTPLWVALVEVLILKTLLDRRVWVGLVLALCGALLFSLAGSDAGGSMGPNPSLGILFALAAALFSTVYFILARTVRSRVSALPYLWLSLISGVVMLQVVTLAAGVPLTGYPLEGYFWVLLVTCTGQIVGQFLMAYTLAYLPATVVSVAMLGQVIIGTGVAYVVFAESPGLLQIVASLVILVGVGAVITARETAHPSA